MLAINQNVTEFFFIERERDATLLILLGCINVGEVIPFS